MAPGGFGSASLNTKKTRRGHAFALGSRVEEEPLLQRKDFPHVAAGMQTIAISNTNHASTVGRDTPTTTPFAYLMDITPRCPLCILCTIAEL